MRKNITFSAEEALIERARLRAVKENRTLNEAFRDWLASYSGIQNSLNVEEIFKRFGHVQAGGPFSREEMNERG